MASLTIGHAVKVTESLNGKSCEKVLAVLCLARVTCLFSLPDEFLWAARSDRQAEGDREE